MDLEELLGRAKESPMRDDTHHFLPSAHAVYLEMEKYGACPYFDLSSVVSGYSKALETEVRYRFFEVFKESNLRAALPKTHPPGPVETSLKALRGYVDQGKCINLGQMAHCLSNLVCGRRSPEPNGFRQFVGELVGDLDAFCKDARVPSLLIEYAKRMRNPAAHGDWVTREQLMEARSFLFEPPRELLIKVLTIPKWKRTKSYSDDPPAPGTV